MSCAFFFFFFFFNDTATTEIYTLSLHDALPISSEARAVRSGAGRAGGAGRDNEEYTDLMRLVRARNVITVTRSEEHTSELQSQSNLVFRLLLEKKKKTLSILEVMSYDRTFKSTY